MKTQQPSLKFLVLMIFSLCLPYSIIQAQELEEELAVGYFIQQKWYQRKTWAIGCAVAGGVCGAVLTSTSHRRGPAGYKGCRGKAGHHGPKGHQGVVGLEGPMGSIGSQGDIQIGRIGPRGEQGSVGPSGSVGSTGDQGACGLTGTAEPNPFKKDEEHVLVFTFAIESNTLPSSFNLILLTPSGCLLPSTQINDITYQWTVHYPEYGAYHLILNYTHLELEPISVILSSKIFMSRGRANFVKLLESTPFLFASGTHQLTYVFVYPSKAE